jgi:uncharacterized membrane protein
MARVEARHHHQLEGRALDASIEFKRRAFTEARIGQCFALLIGFAGIVAAAYCGTHGAQATGSVIGGSTVVGSVTIFICGRRGNRRKRGVFDRGDP